MRRMSKGEPEPAPVQCVGINDEHVHILDTKRSVNIELGPADAEENE